MPVMNPQKTVWPTSIECGGTAVVTISFEAAAALTADPADIVLLMDRSSSMCDAKLQCAKAAAISLVEAVADAGGGGPILTDGSRIGLISFSNNARVEFGFSQNTAVMKSAIHALTAGGSTNHRAAFETAEAILPFKSGKRQIAVMFTDGVTTIGGDPDPVADRMKKAGVEIYCIALGQDRTQLNIWATAPVETHVAAYDNPAELDRMLRKIASPMIVPGARGAVLHEKVMKDFEIIRLGTSTHGTVQQIDPQTLIWTPGTVGLTQKPETVSLSFEIRHIGRESGRKLINETLAYEDCACSHLVFPNPVLQIQCGGGGIYPEPCPEPTEIIFPGCQDSVYEELHPASLMSLGRMIQMDVTIKAVCPGKRAAVSVILTEIDRCGAEQPRGVKHFLIPAQTGEKCRDVTLRCIQFSLPEALDASGQSDTICNPRKFAARVIANYVDTDFTCCDAENVIL